MATNHQNVGPGSVNLPSASSITCLACRRFMGIPPAPQSHRDELATPLPRVPSTTALHLSQWHHCWSFTQRQCSGLIVALARAHSSGKMASTSCPVCACSPLRPRPPVAPLTVCWTDLSTLPDPALPHTMALVPSTLVCPGNVTVTLCPMTTCSSPACCLPLLPGLTLCPQEGFVPDIPGSSRASLIACVVWFTAFGVCSLPHWSL